MRAVVLLIALAAAVGGQVPNPDHFVAVGVGYQGNTLTGWFNVCTKASERLYGCIATDRSGTTSSTRAGVENLLVRGKYFIVTMKADVGGALGANNSSGASYGVGSSALIGLGWLKLSDTYLVGSASWLKSNVQEATNVTFGSRPTIRFGIGKSF